MEYWSDGFATPILQYSITPNNRRPVALHFWESSRFYPVIFDLSPAFGFVKLITECAGTSNRSLTSIRLSLRERFEPRHSSS
jgi:hypothetical protein